MPFSTTKSAFWAGVRDGAPFILVATPFATLFGVLATEAGLKVYEVMTFSLAVMAGAAQFTALQLMTDGVPTFIVLISALAVNLRVAMYSAALTPYLGGAPMWQRVFAAYVLVDQSYALSVAKFEDEPQLSLGQRLRYYFGTNLLIGPVWIGATFVGAFLGSRIPESWAIDFAMPITFLALIAPLLRTPAHVAAALVGSLASLATVWVPYNLGLIIAGMLGMMTGAQLELMLARRGIKT